MNATIIIVILLLFFTVDIISSKNSINKKRAKKRAELENQLVESDPFSAGFLDKYFGFNWGDKEAYEYPMIYRYFGLVVGHGDIGRSSFKTSVTKKSKYEHIKSLFCLSTNFSLCLGYIDQFPYVSPNKTRSLIIGGTNQRMGTIYGEIMDIPKNKFTSIWFQSKDVDDPSIRTLPMGFLPVIVYATGEETIKAAMIKSQTSTVTLRRDLTCIPYNTYSDTRDAANLRRFVNTSQFLKAVAWRTDTYWDSMVNCNFLFVPARIGIQSSQIFEALLVRTIPVVSNGTKGDPHYPFFDLKAQGYPIIIVDSWNIITTTMISDWYTHIYLKTNWEKVRAMLTVKYAINHILNS